MKRLSPPLVLAFILLATQPCFPWSGKCVGIADGDTIRVMHQGNAERIRLYGIDCPERGQDFGTRARRFTSDMVYGKVVDVEPVDRDAVFADEDKITCPRVLVREYDFVMIGETVRVGIYNHLAEASQGRDSMGFERSHHIKTPF